jgi:hypothetical protein
MDLIPTVKIKSDSRVGFALINESDYDSKIHQLFDEVKIESTRKTQRKKSEEVTE